MQTSLLWLHGSGGVRSCFTLDRINWDWVNSVASCIRTWYQVVLPARRNPLHSAHVRKSPPDCHKSTKSSCALQRKASDQMMRNCTVLVMNRRVLFEKHLDASSHVCNSNFCAQAKPTVPIASWSTVTFVPWNALAVTFNVFLPYS